MNGSEKTKEQLIEEIKLLRTLIDSLPDRLYIKDKNARFIVCNKAVADYVEIPVSGDIVGKSDFDLFSADRAKEFFEAEQEIIRTGKPKVNEEVCAPIQGKKELIWSLSTKLPWRNNTGEIVGIIGSNRDITEHKKAIQALQESETRYKTIFEAAREGIIVGIIETRQFTYANPAICKIFGYTFEELTRLTVNDIHPKEHLQYAAERFKAFMRGEVAFTQDLPCLRKNGTVFYADISATRIVINNKDCFVGFFTDTTERKHTEDALRESEARYRAIFNYATEGIVVTDVETKRHKVVNPAACRMFGYTAEEFQQMSVYDIHPKEYMPSVIAGLEAQARGEITLVANVPCLHKNGTVFYADIDATCVVIDQRPCNVGLFTNITERKGAEEALRQSEGKFRGITERSFDMVFITNEKGFITYLSPASERIFGYSPEEMTGKHFMNFLKESEIPKATQRFMAKLKGEDHGILYLEAKKKNGDGIFIELNSNLIVQDGKVLGTQGIIRDVTESKKVEEELKKAQAELENRVRQRTADLANAVEELQKEIAERKRVEQSLRQAEERFRTIFENTIIGLYRTTPDGQILLANPALVKMLGYESFGELSQVNLEKGGLAHSTPRSIFKQRIEKEGRVLGLESVWLRKDGSKLFVAESAFVVRDSDGKTLYYEGTAQDISQRKEAEEKLMHYQEKLRSLASELSLAEERLRRRIASDLHDNISQNLAISKMKLESLTEAVNTTQANELREVTNLIAQTIEVTRSLTFEMSPPVLYELGFESAVRWLTNQTRQRFGIDAEFIDDEKDKPLDNDIRVLLFQATRELLANVVKHSKAKKVTITAARLSQSDISDGPARGKKKVADSKIPDQIRIIIEDDGIGFDVNNRKEGFGLFNIRERLDHIGGSFEIQSKPQHGTCVTLFAPLLKSKTKNNKLKKNNKIE